MFRQGFLGAGRGIGNDGRTQMAGNPRDILLGSRGKGKKQYTVSTGCKGISAGTSTHEFRLA